MKAILKTILVVTFAARLLAVDLPSIYGDEVDFPKEIAPLLERHCIRCHSPGNKKGDISIATIDDLKENEHVVSGNPENSHLLDLITGVDGEPPEMPKDAKPLSKVQVDLIRRWIAEGAKWPKNVVLVERSRADASWWSLQPLATHPDVKTIDEFIDAKLQEKKLQRNPTADRVTLIRRATYDLTGLPPTPAAVAAFVNDNNPRAYETLIDRLLDSPHYGERWGRHWLDVVRFGESIGFERNVIVNNIWPFRDYVIRSINADKPFDRLIREHIAGDVFGLDDPQVAIGSAFLVAGPYDDVGNQDAAQQAQIRANTLDEIISATGQAFLGLTIGCARCHDHKFDPITQKDYYSLYATFSGIRHGSVPMATAKAKAERAAKLAPLEERKAKLESSLEELRTTILKRAHERVAEYEARWTRPSVDRTGTEEKFAPVEAKFVRLICEAQDQNPSSANGFRIDEFEVWSSGDQPENVALRANGGKAFGKARHIEDFAGAYAAELAIDGKQGARYLAVNNDLTIELSKPTRIDRVVFSSARGEINPQHTKFVFVADYRIEASVDGKMWTEVAHGRDRRPTRIGDDDTRHLNHRLLKLETTKDEKIKQKKLRKELTDLKRQVAEIPEFPSVWIGQRNANDAKGPFHVFLGGNPQKKGDTVVPTSLTALAAGRKTDSVGVENSHNDALGLDYRLSADAPETDRRLAFSKWLTHPDNPLTPRVLANRIWHYHFGTGIVNTPSDFGYMGGKPAHPELLDFLAIKLQENGWRIKAMHRLIMNSETYRQSSAYRETAAKTDSEARLLWRFPPRRLSAEEIRDTVLMVSGKLKTINLEMKGAAELNNSTADQSSDEDQLVPDGGPGFRLYHFMQDNVCTYVPLEKHGPETYRRAVYHQNARASVVDLMTDFDQPDCAFSTPKRAETTTPLQALTMLNHSFTLDMAKALAERLRREAGDDVVAQLRHAYQLCYSRRPSEDELQSCRELIGEHGLEAVCRVLLNTSELIYVR